jgi:CheY-like chemotaxis protein
VLIVEADARVRQTLMQQLGELRITLLEASDGVTALKMLVCDPTIAVVVTNLNLAAGDDTCLTHAIRKTPALQRTAIVVHTTHENRKAQEWARAGGASAFLVSPAKPERLRYVVGRLLSAWKRQLSGQAGNGSTVRRPSLGLALEDIEGGRITGTNCIVFNLAWWEGLSPRERNGFRRRSKTAGVALRTDSSMTPHSVEMRGTTDGPRTHRRTV